MERIEPKTLYKLIYDLESPEQLGYEIISNTITSADAEDGGADHTLVIKRLSDGEYFKTFYCDWDMDNTDYDEEDDEIGERCDLNCVLSPVKPKTITITVYE